VRGVIPCCCAVHRSHPFDLSVLLERIAEALTPSEPAVCASLARSQLLSLAGHIGRQARYAWATAPDTAARAAACSVVDEQGERLLAGLRSLADEEAFIGTASPRKSKQQRKRTIAGGGPRKNNKRKLEPTLSERTTVGSADTDAQTAKGVDTAAGGGGDDEEEAGQSSKRQRVVASDVKSSGSDQGENGAAAMSVDAAAPVKLEDAEDTAGNQPGAGTASAASNSTSNGNSSSISSDEDDDDDGEESSEEEIVPRATRSSRTAPGGAAASGEGADDEEGDESSSDEVERKVRNETEFVGQRELDYTWRPLDTPLDAPGFTNTPVRCSTHSSAAKVLLAVTDVLMLVTRKDRVFANKKLVVLKGWLETHEVPILYYGFRPRGWSGNEERSDTQEYRGKMTPCVAYENVRFVLRWLCGSKGRSADLVASWKEAGGRQWLQAEIENATSELDPQQRQQCGGDATVAALRTRFHRQTEQEQLAKDIKEKERLVEALPRWYKLLCRATGRATARAAAAAAAAAAVADAEGGKSEEEAAAAEEGWPAARRPVWLRERHGRAVLPPATVDETLAELVYALRRAGSFPLYRTVPAAAAAAAAATGKKAEEEEEASSAVVSTEVPPDTSLAVAAQEGDIAELPPAAQALGKCVLLSGRAVSVFQRG
jgi:hypothetical protein